MDPQIFDTIILQAIDEEIAAANFYREAARRMQDPSVKDIFERLAADENHHRDTLETFRFDPVARLEFEHVVDFHVSEKEAMPALSFEMTPREAFQLAMKKEEQALKAYTRMAEGCRHAEMRRIYLELAEMERGHKTKLEELFVNAACPEVW
jgi:rubrerythrin